MLIVDTSEHEVQLYIWVNCSSLFVYV